MASRLAPTNPAVGQASASRRLSGQKASVRRMAVVAHAQDGEGVMSKVGGLIVRSWVWHVLQR